MVERRKFRYLPILVIGLSISLIGVGAFKLVHNFLITAPVQEKKVVQEIHLIRPPPPPPDQPPPPPPPPEEKVQVPEPQQQPDPTPSNEPPPSQQLGLDAEGGSGSDDFGLAGNKGGRELLASGGSAYAWYAGLLKNQILDLLNDDKQPRGGQYTVVVRVWVRDDGTIERVAIEKGSGNRDRDRTIETALTRIARLPQAPPADMPEPISLRIVSR